MPQGRKKRNREPQACAGWAACSRGVVLCFAASSLVHKDHFSCHIVSCFRFRRDCVFVISNEKLRFWNHRSPKSQIHPKDILAQGRKKRSREPQACAGWSACSSGVVLCFAASSLVHKDHFLCHVVSCFRFRRDCVFVISNTENFRFRESVFVPES